MAKAMYQAVLLHKATGLCIFCVTSNKNSLFLNVIKCDNVVSQLDAPDPMDIG